MTGISRRRALTLGGAALGAGISIRHAKAAEPVNVWWTQGFYQAEDQAVIGAMKAWEQASGTKVNLTIMNGPDLISKMIAAMQVGDVPDLVHAVTGDRFLVPRAAWDDKLVDVSDVIETQKHEFTPSALAGSRLYNQAKKAYSYYTVPVKCSSLMNEVWLPLTEEAGFTRDNIPKTQDAYYDFFQTVQDKLRSKGKRIYGLGYSMATKEADSGNLFHAFLVNYGGGAIVLPDGKLNIDDPAVRKAAVTSLERLTTPFKKGYVPPGAINWGDVDNNNAFYAKQIVMTPNATISIAVAQMEKPDQYYKQIITSGMPNANDGSAMPTLVGCSPCLIPKGAKNIDGAKALLSAFIQPANLNNYLKETRGRYLPTMPSIVKNDPYWMDPADPHRSVAVQEVLMRPATPWWMAYNPAYAAVLSEQVWIQAEANITQKGMTPEQACDGAVERIKSIFERFRIA